MIISSAKDDLVLLRSMLEPLVDRFELDDPMRGLVGVVTVVGGVFMHPLTRIPIRMLKIYGAGRDQVKIAEPVFLRSLPRIPVERLTHSSQLCARVAKTLSQALGELGTVREQVSAMGITMDLEYHALRLLGRVELQGMRVKVVTSRPGELIVTSLGDTNISGLVPREQRTLKLKNEPTTDLDELAKLVTALNKHFKRKALEDMEQSLGIQPGPEEAPAPRVVQELARETSGVVELTETVEEEEETAELPVAPAAPEPEQAQAPAQKPAQTPTPAQAPEPSLGALGLRRLLDCLGFDAEISAHGNKLRLMVPLKVIQGEYVFFLEQRGPTHFVGVLHSPRGSRHLVEFDLAKTTDIKEVFDRVVMGKDSADGNESG